MTVVNFTDEDVSVFLKNILESSGCLKVDDSPDRFVRELASDGSEGEVKTIKGVDGKQHPIAIYGTKNSDAVIMNPFAEGASTTAKDTWWYLNLNAYLGANVAILLHYLIKMAIDSNKDKKGNKKIDLAVIKLLGTAINDIDDKTVNELNQLVKKVDEPFIGIYYDKSTKSSKLKCLVFSEAQRKAYSTVRKMTWRALSTILLNIFECKDFSEYDTSATLMAIPVFETYTRVYVKVMKCLSTKLSLAGIKINNLGAIDSGLKYLEYYHSRAKWCTSTPVPSVTTAPNAVTAAPAAIKPINAVPATNSLKPIAVMPQHATGITPQVQPIQLSPAAMPTVQPMVPAVQPMAAGIQPLVSAYPGQVSVTPIRATTPINLPACRPIARPW